MPIVALVPCLALAGCVGAAPSRTQGLAAGSPATATSSRSKQVMPAASGIVDTVWVDVYPGPTFPSKQGCHCTLPGSPQELFPAGTPVILLKVTMTGEWKPSQGGRTSQDVTGTSLKGTRFDGRPDPAVLDTADGPAAAMAAGLPWLPGGLFHGRRDWRIPNDKGRSFAAAYYLPPGVDQLELSVDVPAEGAPNVLTVPLPASATGATGGRGE